MSTRRLIVTFIAGFIFAIGLGVSGMTQPAKVVGFLDITGSWDPSLAFVMGGAIAVHFIAYRLVPRMPAPWLGDRFGIPSRRDIDKRLVAGGVLFGLGWGLGGFCPGPALVSLVAGTSSALIFGASMIGGMLIFQLLDRLLRRRQSAPSLEIKPMKAPEIPRPPASAASNEIGRSDPATA